MVIGGYAVSIHGYTRFTEDIDVTLGLGAAESEKIMNLLSELNCLPLVKDPIEFINTTWVLPVQEQTTKSRIDFIFSFTEFEANAIKNSYKLVLKGKEVKFCSLDDLLLLKIFSGRPKDLDDVKSIHIQRKDIINFEYIYKWLEKFSIDSDKDYVKLFNETIKD
jgi:hypothetical protein